MLWGDSFSFCSGMGPFLTFNFIALMAPQVGHAHELQAGKLRRVNHFQVVLGTMAVSEADALCLAQARFQMGHAAHLPPRPTSPMAMVFSSTGRSSRLDASAMQTGRSQAVSSSFRPPMMLM